MVAPSIDFNGIPIVLHAENQTKTLRLFTRGVSYIFSQNDLRRDSVSSSGIHHCCVHVAVLVGWNVALKETYRPRDELIG